MDRMIKCRTLFVTSPRVRSNLADATHLRQFFYDPRFTTPLNVPALDTKEYVVKSILRHDFADPENKRWLVYWALDGDEDETWEPFEVLNDVELFQTYCATHGMSTLFPKKHSLPA